MNAVNFDYTTNIICLFTYSLNITSEIIGMQMEIDIAFCILECVQLHCNADFLLAMTHFVKQV
jgi:hypothetical protein